MGTRVRTYAVLAAVVALLLVLSIGLAACGGGETTTTAAPSTDTTAAESTTTSAAPAGPIKIGFSGPLTGNGAAVGQDYLNGVMLYFDKVNAAGGINGQQIEIVKEDDLMDPKNSTVVAQKLVDAGVVAVLGPLTSGSTIPTMSIYGDAQIAQITPASNPDVTAQGFTHIFRVDPDDLAQGGNIGRYAFNTLGAKSVAIINDKQAFGQGVSEEFQKAFEAAGGTVTSVNSITPGDVDFRAVLTKINSENPDMVYFGGVAQEGGLIVKQMRDLGMEQIFFAPDQCFGPEFIKIGGEATEGAFISYQGPPLDSTPELAQFLDDFTEAFGAEPFVAQFGYVSAQLVEGAILAAGKAEGPAIIEALHAGEFPTILGVYTFEENGAMGGGGTIYVYTVENGKNVFVEASMPE